MHVVEQRPPCRVVVEGRVGEADQAAVLGQDRATARIGLAQPLAPHRQAVGEEITVEKSVGIGIPVVTAPTRSVKIGDGLGIGRAGEAKLHGVDVHPTSVAAPLPGEVAAFQATQAMPRARLELAPPD